MKLLIIFIVLNIANVIIQTIRSLATIKCGKVVASLVNALAYGLYTVVIVYTNCELSLISKVLIVAITNLIGVYVVKFIEEKMRKDRLWEIKFTYKGTDYKDIEKTLKANGISCCTINLRNGYIQFLTWCQTQDETKFVAKIIKSYGCKYFINENKCVL